MLKVYEYLNAISQHVIDCDMLYGCYDEVKQAYSSTVLAEITSQKLIDFVEDAIIRADAHTKEVAIKRLKQRIADILIEFEQYSAQIDFTEATDNSVYGFIADNYYILLEFNTLLDELCNSYEIKIEPFKLEDGQILPVRAAALVCIYRGTKITRNKAGNITPEFGIRSGETLYTNYNELSKYERRTSDPHNWQSLSTRKKLIELAIGYLKANGLKTDEAEQDLAINVKLLEKYDK